MGDRSKHPNVFVFKLEAYMEKKVAYLSVRYLLFHICRQIKTFITIKNTPVSLYSKTNYIEGKYTGANIVGDIKLI